MALAGDNASGEGYSLWAYMTTLSDGSASVISIVGTHRRGRGYWSGAAAPMSSASLARWRG
jgi:hypothetical protein